MLLACLPDFVPACERRTCVLHTLRARGRVEPLARRLSECTPVLRAAAAARPPVSHLCLPIQVKILAKTGSRVVVAMAFPTI